VNGIEAPNRAAWAYEADNLIKLDNSSSSLRPDAPNGLPITAIQLSPAVFQARYQSLAFAPGHSEKHIRRLTSVARKGQELDPIKVVGFGDKWFLIDGHHRLEAYKRANWLREVPVQAMFSPLTGRDRVNWAAQVSTTENGKDRLNISDSDRCDAAWRAVVQNHGSKRQTALDFGVSERTVANMREAKLALERHGEKTGGLMSFGWRQVAYEVRRREALTDENTFDFEEAKRRKIAKRLVPVLQMRPSAQLLLELLEAARPGMAIELETVINSAKAEHRERESAEARMRAAVPD
jgi:ParB-like chromosome segregation protein Spo0J